MNALNMITQLLVAPAKPQASRALDASKLFPAPSGAPTAFRMRSYTPEAYGASYSRSLRGRYTR